ncbi:MAG: ketoacyl-ACP synthase III [candidate division WOR-3 bacterium]|nr:ketoacyl-ACP synthase III [candidate division WOR-3 bacterium]
MKAYIAGIGIYVPEKVLTNFDLEKIVETSDEWIRTRTGIRERRIVDENTATSDLAVIAAKRAIEDAGVKPGAIDAIILGTATPDMLFPSTACIVQSKIGARKVMAFDISAGCSGFLYGLGIADAMIKNGYDNILVIGAEALSKVMDFTDRATCVLFGDGAGAAVVKKNNDDESGIISSYFASDGSDWKLLHQPAGGSRIPASEESVKKRLHYIKMEGNEVFKLAVRAMIESAIETLKKANLSPKDIALLIPHQANIRIIEATAKRLDIPMEKVYVNLDRYGNTSAASIPIALAEARAEGRIKKGDYVLMVAFGAGFTWGGLLMRM